MSPSQGLTLTATLGCRTSAVARDFLDVPLAHTHTHNLAARHRSRCLNDPDARSRPGPRPLISLDDAQRRFYVRSPRLVVASRLGRARGVDRPTVARWVTASIARGDVCARSRRRRIHTCLARVGRAQKFPRALDALVRPLWVGPSRAGVCGAASARAWDAIKRLHASTRGAARGVQDE